MYQEVLNLRIKQAKLQTSHREEVRSYNMSHIMQPFFLVKHAVNVEERWRRGGGDVEELWRKGNSSWLIVTD
jgi:hypothetical protein